MIFYNLSTDVEDHYLALSNFEFEILSYEKVWKKNAGILKACQRKIAGLFSVLILLSKCQKRKEKGAENRMRSVKH